MTGVQTCALPISTIFFLICKYRNKARDLGSHSSVTESCWRNIIYLSPLTLYSLAAHLCGTLVAAPNPLFHTLPSGAGVGTLQTHFCFSSWLRVRLSGFPGGASGKEPACQCRDVRNAGSIPGSGRSPGGGHSNPLQYSCLENPMDRGAWWTTVHRVTQSQTQLK